MPLDLMEQLNSTINDNVIVVYILLSNCLIAFGQYVSGSQTASLPLIESNRTHTLLVYECNACTSTCKLGGGNIFCDTTLQNYLDVLVRNWHVFIILISSYINSVR